MVVRAVTSFLPNVFSPKPGQCFCPCVRLQVHLKDISFYCLAIIWVVKVYITVTASFRKAYFLFVNPGGPWKSIPAAASPFHPTVSWQCTPSAF